jgi:hypothetical protein
MGRRWWELKFSDRNNRADESHRRDDQGDQDGNQPGTASEQCKKQRRGGGDEGNVYLARGPDCILRQITDRFDIALSDGAASRAGCDS